MGLDELVGKVIIGIILFAIGGTALGAFFDYLSDQAKKSKERAEKERKAAIAKSFAEQQQKAERQRQEYQKKFGQNEEYKEKWRQNDVYKKIFKEVIGYVANTIKHMQTNTIYGQKPTEVEYTYEVLFNGDRVMYGRREYDYTQELYRFAIGVNEYRFYEYTVSQEQREAFVRGVMEELQKRFPEILFRCFGGQSSISMQISFYNYAKYQEKKEIF